MRYEPRTKPFKHQARATLKAVRHRNFALFMEPRTGKSKAALDAAAILRLKGEVERVAILCPKVALEVWDTQIRAHFPFESQIEDYQYRWGYTRGRQPGYATRFYLLGYERAARRERRHSKWFRPYLSKVEAWDPDLLILDESHRLKRAGGVTSQGLWRMVTRLRKRRREEGRSGPYVVLLSGTPAPKGKIDLFAQYRIMDESIFGTAKAGFEDEYVVYGKGRKTKYKIMRYRNERRLDRLTRAHSFSISQEEAGLSREQFTQNLTVRLPPRIKEKYNELAELFITQIDGTVVEGKNSGAIRTRLLQVTGGFTTDGTLLHREKLEKLGEYANLVVEQGEPLLIYCRYTPEVAACVELASKCGFRSFPFEGATSDKDRRLALRTLRTSSSVRPTCVVFQVQAGSLALDLSSAAEVVYYSLPDGWEAYWQSRNRVLGPNQQRPVRFTHILAVGTLDRQVLRNLQAKEELHGSMMRNPRRYLTGL